jgi:hypothetical protein
MPSFARLHLRPGHFGDGEQFLAESGDLTASTLTFASGVRAVRVRGPRGEMVVLPFQGQQIWSLALAPEGGPPRPLGFRAMMAEPQPTRDFLATFGGFLQHCGLLAVGGPGPTDTHPLHGELPNAPFQQAWVAVGEDARGPFVGVGGRYTHGVAFSHNYAFEPLVKMYGDASLVNITVDVTNQKQTPMEMFYLAHVNFRPVDHGRIVYSAQRTPAHVRARTEIPGHITPKPGYREFLEQLGRDPTVHETLLPGQAYDPEAVFFIDYEADGDGWAHTMQVHPDGSADYLRHRPAELRRATRWISRTADQDAIALAEVGTSEPEGYTREKEKGNAMVLGPGERYHASFDAGVLAADDARRMEQHIGSFVRP